jgi:hypothetical protein
VVLAYSLSQDEVKCGEARRDWPQILQQAPFHSLRQDPMMTRELINAELAAELKVTWRLGTSFACEAEDRRPHRYGNRDGGCGDLDAYLINCGVSRTLTCIGT